MVREVKGKEMMCVLVAGRGARERGGRRLEVKVHSKRRSPCHNVAYLVLETIEESCAFGEDIVLVGLRVLSGKSKELLGLAVSVVEQQAKELCVDAARGTECRRQEADAGSFA